MVRRGFRGYHWPMNDSPDIVVVGGINFDFLGRGAHLPRAGQTRRGEQFQAAPGGKGLNQAVACALLGAKTALVARVGQDETGKRALKTLEEAGVSAAHVVRDDGAHTGRALIMVDRDGRKAILAIAGANARLTPSDVKAAAPLIKKAKVVVISLEAPLAAALAAARLAREAGAKVVLDPAPAMPLPDELLSLCDVARPDAFEAHVLTGVEVNSRADAKRAGRRLLKLGVGAAVVEAPGGDLVVSAEGERWLAHYKLQAVDSTGAGDAFVAGLAVGLAHGASTGQAAALGAAAAALKTTKLGAVSGLPTLAEVLHLLGTGREGLLKTLTQGREPKLRASPHRRRTHGRRLLRNGLRGSTVRGLPII